MSLTKEDLNQIEGMLDKKLDEKLGAQTKELKAFAEEQTEHLARIISTTIADPMEKNFKIINDRLAVQESRVWEPKKGYKAN